MNLLPATNEEKEDENQADSELKSSQLVLSEEEEFEANPKLYMSEAIQGKEEKKISNLRFNSGAVAFTKQLE